MNYFQSKKRMRPHKTKKVKSSSDDDESEWVQLAMLGLSAMSAVSGASGKSQQAKAESAQNNLALGEINESLNLLEEGSYQQTKVIEDEAEFTFHTEADNTQVSLENMEIMKEDIGASTGFAGSFEAEETINREEKNIQGGFENRTEEIQRNKDKNIAMVKERQIKEEGRLTSEKSRLLASNRALDKQKSTVKNLFGF
tara:strand:+ start:50 stop:643 length:594 start_codon:yes stop_codon:yes gene_type:complete